MAISLQTRGFLPVELAATMVVALLFGGCADATSQCAAAVVEKNVADAQATCESEFLESGDVQVAHVAATTAVAAGNIDLALGWADRVRGTITQGNIVRESGLAAWRAGEVTRAKTLFEKAAQIYGQLDDHARHGQALYNLHYLAWSESDHQPGLDYAQRALVAAERGDDRKVQVNALVGMASIFEETGLLEAARLALSAAAERVAPSHVSGQFNIANSRGVVEMQAQRYGIALGHLQTADKISPRVGNNLKLRVMLNLTSTYLALERPQDAADSLSRALRIVGDAPPSYAVLFYSGRVALAQGRIDEAEAAFKQALVRDQLPQLWRWEIVYWQAMTAQRRGDEAATEALLVAAIDELEAAGRTMQLADLTAHLIDSRRKPYQALFELLLSQDRGRDAFAVVERAKSTVISDSMIEQTDRMANTSSTGVLHEQIDLNQRLSRTFIRAGLQQAPGNLTAIHAALGRHQALVYYSSQTHLWSIKLADGRIHMPEQPLRLDRLAELVDATLSPGTDDEAFERLGRALIPPNVVPTAGARLIIVPDTSLRRVGFGALRLNGRALIDDHVISYLPNTTSLLRRHALPAQTPHVTVLADPLGDLPAAKLEGERVALAHNAQAYVGPSATHDALRTARHARLLHLATHSGHDAMGPWLALADGRVRTSDIVAAKVAPELVVIASCASAQTRVQGYWGSVAGGFLDAGARHVLGTLWSVDDNEVAQLIEWFYTAPGDEPAGQLAAAQRRARDAGMATRAWSGLIMLGPPLN